MKKQVKILLSSLMAIYLCLNSNAITSFATDVTPGTSTTGNGGHLSSADGKTYVLQRPVVMVTLDTVKNTGTNKKDSGYSDLAVSTVDSYLYTIPEKFQNTTAAKTSALINICMNDMPKPPMTYSYVVDELISNSNFNNAYTTHKNGQKKHHSSFTLNGVSNFIKANNQVDEFSNKKLSIDVVKEYAAANAAAINNSITEFVYCWDYPEDAAKCMMSIFDGTKDNGNEARLRYLDFLVMINHMTGSKNWSVVENYLNTLNLDGSKNFSVVEFASGVHYGDGGKDKLVYTTQSYYSTVTNKAMVDYLSISPNKKQKALDEVKSVVPSYDDDPVGYTQALYDLYNNVSGGKCIGEFSRGWGGNRDLQFWTEKQYSLAGFSSFRAATICMPTNLAGKRTGATGYTIFSDAIANLEMTPGGPGGPGTSSVGGFDITATTDKNMVYEPGEYVQADVNINLKQDKKDIPVILNELGKAKAYTLEAKLELGTEGSEPSEQMLDALKSPAGGTISDNTNKSVTITKDGMSQADLESFLNGNKQISFVDSNIFIDQETAFTYSASVKIKGENEIDLNARGKTIVSGTVASDRVEWGYKVGVGSYYSGLREPYVEIKEGSPGNETFEAMAGVPTTENLYAGFGAQEFMLNLEAEKKSSSGSRNYTMKYTADNCTELNEKCTYSCPGHTVSVPSHDIGGDKDNPETCPGDTVTGYCTNGTITLTADCGHSSETKTFNPLAPCDWNDGSRGCVHNQKINQAHSHVHEFTGKINQPIDEFNYLDITGLELWQVNKLEIQGNSSLFSEPNLSVDPNTGFNTYYDQEGYENNNGRLAFSYVLADDKNRWGDTSQSKKEAAFITKAEADENATNWMNDILDNAQVKATVISDYVVLGTTRGYQSASYHQYDSDTVPISSERFTTGSESKSVAGDNITFSPVEWVEFWGDNPNSSAKWDSMHIARSGYNGDYGSPTTKYNNSTSASKTNPTAWLDGQPNANIDDSDGISGDGTKNKRMTIKNINVIDSTDTSTKAWSADDDVNPVSNGIKDTGHCYLYAPKVISFNSTAGKDWSNDVNQYKTEVPYTEGQNKVNDIVIHNPVSAQYATVVANDKQYDLRTAESLAEGEDVQTEDRELSSNCKL